MKDAVKKGMGFGLSSAIITTLGIIVGTHSTTDLKHAVIGAILVVAFADSLADSLGVYFSEVAREKCEKIEAFVSAISAFFTKFIFAMTFLIPILIFELHTAIIVCICYGLIVLGVYGFYTAKTKKESIFQNVVWYILLALVVIVASHYLGLFINQRFS